MTSYYLYSAVPFLVVGGFVFWAAYAAWSRRRKEKERLRELARTFGFSFSEPESRSNFLRLIGGWEMAGRYNGVAVHMYGKKVSGQNGNSETTFIDATANCRRKFELLITRETTLSRMGGSLLGLQDVTTGNAELDQRVVVKGVPTHLVQRVVDNRDLQRELVRLFEQQGWIHVDLRGAHYRRAEIPADERSLRSLLDALTRTASALETATA